MLCLVSTLAAGLHVSVCARRRRFARIKGSTLACTKRDEFMSSELVKAGPRELDAGAVL